MKKLGRVSESKGTLPYSVSVLYIPADEKVGRLEVPVHDALPMQEAHPSQQHHHVPLYLKKSRVATCATFSNNLKIENLDLIFLNTFCIQYTC